MLLIRPELLFHEYDLATQSCIEPIPSGDLRNAEKHHVATKRFARFAEIHCSATHHLGVTSYLTLNLVSVEIAVILVK